MYSRQNPSPRYTELLGFYKIMHERGYWCYNPEVGVHWIEPDSSFNSSEIIRHESKIRDLIAQYDCSTLLDYGSGKSEAFKKLDLGVEKTLWDPAIDGEPPLSQQFDIVTCTDVLEHIPKADMEWVFTEILNMAKKVVFIGVPCQKAYALLPDYTNAHVTVEKPDWWFDTLYGIRAKVKPEVKLVVTCEQVE